MSDGKVIRKCALGNSIWLTNAMENFYAEFLIQITRSRRSQFIEGAVVNGQFFAFLNISFGKESEFFVYFDVWSF